MPDSGEAYTLRTVASLTEIDAAEWDACAGADNPFVSHGFLAALEESGSATAESGWVPQHLVLNDGAGRTVAAVPLYLKNHSYGEYVFDWGWADAFERAGGEYYPKLQCSVPFTPVSGPRLLVRPGPEAAGIQAAVAQALQELAGSLEVSSLHITFCSAAEQALFKRSGYLLRRGLQYHWNNRDFASFDDFLASLVSRKRKAIKKERRKVAEAGITTRVLGGEDIKPQHWDLFYRFYHATSDKKWGQAYLTREFFELLQERLGDRVALVIAEDGDRIVAGALNLIGADTLYGRNWGCLGWYKFLHFETCYYAAIDFAIERGLQRVEAGAQGEHKIQRGYEASETFSAHWIAHEGFRAAIADYLERESRGRDREIEIIAAHSPYRQE